MCQKVSKKGGKGSTHSRGDDPGVATHRLPPIHIVYVEPGTPWNKLDLELAKTEAGNVAMDAEALEEHLHGRCVVGLGSTGRDPDDVGGVEELDDTGVRQEVERVFLAERPGAPRTAIARTHEDDKTVADVGVETWVTALLVRLLVHRQAEDPDGLRWRLYDDLNRFLVRAHLAESARTLKLRATAEETLSRVFKGVAQAVAMVLVQADAEVCGTEGALGIHC